MSGANGSVGYRPCLVLAHPNLAYCADVGRSFRRLGWDVYPVQRGPEARRLARMLEADLVVLDVSLIDETGWLTCAKLTQERPSARVVLVTDDPNPRDDTLADFVGASVVVNRHDGTAVLLAATCAHTLAAAG